MRHHNWVKVLRETVNQYKYEPFSWAENDCCMFAARCADAITGSEWVSDLKSCYHDEPSARAYIESEGSIRESVTRRLGEPVPRLQARRGDICLVESETGPSLAVCIGGYAVGPGVRQQYAIPLSLVICAWRID